MGEGWAGRCKHGLRPELCADCRRPAAARRQAARVVVRPAARRSDGPAVLGYGAALSPAAAVAPAWQGGEPRFGPGDLVRLRIDPSKQGLVQGKPFAGAQGWAYRVFFGAGYAPFVQEAKLDLVEDEPAPVALGHREFLRDLLLIKLAGQLTDTLYSLQSSRTLFRVYQFKPALKFLHAPEQRILIADEVGLGKTIEAGIIYLELKARLDLRRALIVCPSGLREKWRVELASRFDEEFTSLDSAGVRRFLDDYARRGDVVPLKGIVALELLRLEEFADRIAELGVAFDLVVIDEAHHLRNAATLSHRLGEALAHQTGALLLLTATPLQVGNQDLFHLLQLVNPAEFNNLNEFEEVIKPNEFLNGAARRLAAGDPAAALKELQRVEHTQLGFRYRANPHYTTACRLLEQGDALSTPDAVKVQRLLLELNTLAHIFTRTRKRDVADAAERSAFTVRVELTPEERAFYDGVIEFVRWELASGPQSGNVPVFTLITRERQAASCLPALRDRFAEMLKRSSYRLDAEESAAELDHVDSVSRRLDLAERARIEALLRTCRDMGDRDSKFDRFAEAVGRVLAEQPDAKILVFSYFRDTLGYLERRLRRLGYRVGAIHGGLKMADRQRAIDSFREDPAFQILLSSEVGAEGLDFQFCGVMVNYDLPWNPMRVEQRIGRLDRFGQTHERIRIYNLVIEDTIETRIFERLYARIRLFESAIGDLEAILGHEVYELSRAVFADRLTPAEEIARAEQSGRRLERYRQELDEFDEKRQILLGQDALFDQQVENARDSGRYIAPDEVRALVETFLEAAFPRTRLEPNGEDPTYACLPDPDCARHLIGVADRVLGNSEAAREFAARLQTARPIPLTFDADVARERRLVEFVTVRHPLAAAAAEFFTARASVPAPPQARLTLAAPAAVAGDYAFFLYRLDIRCLTPTAELLPVLVDVATGEVREAPAGAFLPALQRLPADPTTPGNGPTLDAARFVDLTDTGQRRISAVAAAREGEVRDRNDALITLRKDSLRLSFDFRLLRVQGWLDQARDARIRRMRQAQRENLLAQRQARLAELEAKRAVSVDYRLVASGLVRLTPDSATVR